MSKPSVFAIRIADLAERYDAMPKKVLNLVENLECTVMGTEDRVFEEAEKIIATNPDDYRFHHVNVPIDGIECPDMWVEYGDDGRITLYLGKHFNKRHTNREEVIAKYVIHDPYCPRIFPNRKTDLADIRACFEDRHRKKKEE